jgi:predicted ATPase/DNA-binding SARP family transcriptional activator
VTLPHPGSLVIRLLGSFEVALNGTPPRFRSRTEEHLLALLTLRHGLEVERDWLAGMLWPETEPSIALGNLRRSLHHLRRTLGPQAARVHSPTPRTLGLDLAGAEADVVAFDDAISRADTASLRQAVTLYRGPLLDGSAEEWVFQERRTREQAYLAALETLAADARERGDPADLESYLRRVVAVDPLRETAQRALMQVSADAGNFAGAIHTYRELRTLLHREMNAEPDPTTRALFDAIRTEARRRAQDHRPPTIDDRPEADHGSLRAGSAEPNEPASVVSGRWSVVESEETLTFLFADVADSARLWEEQADVMRLAVARHDPFLQGAIVEHRGQVLRSVGDTYQAAFGTAADAIAAALAAQRSLQRLEPSAVGEVSGLAPRVRMALHTCAVEVRGGHYSGPALNRAERLLVAARGGQILLSAATQALVQDELPPGVSLRDLGTHRLRDLQRPEHVFQVIHPDLATPSSPLASLTALPNNLPEQVTRFIGREREMAEVRRLLKTVPGPGSQVTSQEPPGVAPTTRGSRLVTITGTAGTGKTRLAMQLAAELLGVHEDGVWSTELAALTDPALVPQALAAALGVREKREIPLVQALVEHLKSKQILVVLDDCEHLLTACATLAEALLRGCPRVVILATSREPLNIPGETLYRLSSLTLPGLGEGSMVEGQWAMTDEPPCPPSTINRGPYARHRSEGVGQPSPLLRSEAVRLFLDRATAAVPSFRLTPQNAAAVAQVCVQLDGIPLAIELAAARVKSLPVDRIAARLDDRFRLLTGGSRTAPPRQQTLRALIDWSYDLLTEPERALLRRVSVFAGGWTLEAAEEVLSVKCEVLSVKSDVGDPGALTLNTQHSTFPLEPGDVLDLLAALVEKSLVIYEEGRDRYRLLETMRQYGRDRLREAEEEAVLRRRHAEWCVQVAERAEIELRGREQIRCLDMLEMERDNLRAALEWSKGAGGSPEVGLRLFGSLRGFWGVRGHFQETRARLREMLALVDPNRHTLERAKALLLAGDLAEQWEGVPPAIAAAEECVALFRALGDPLGLAEGLSLLARLAFVSEAYDQANALWEESLVLARSSGDETRVAGALNGLGRLAFRNGDYARAEELLQECLAVSRASELPRLVAWSLHSLGRLALNQADYPLAQTRFEEARTLFEQIGEPIAHAGVWLQLAQIAARQHAFERASHGIEEAQTLYRQAGYPDTEVGRDILAEIARRQGDFPRAVELYRRSVDRIRSGGVTWGLIDCLDGLAKVAVAAGQPERAARLFGAVEALRGHSGGVRPPAARAEYAEVIDGIRAALGEDQFHAAWSAGLAMTREAAMEEALAED